MQTFTPMGIKMSNEPQINHTEKYLLPFLPPDIVSQGINYPEVIILFW